MSDETYYSTFWIYSRETVMINLTNTNTMIYANTMSVSKYLRRYTTWLDKIVQVGGRSDVSISFSHSISIVLCQYYYENALLYHSSRTLNHRYTVHILWKPKPNNVSRCSDAAVCLYASGEGELVRNLGELIPPKPLPRLYLIVLLYTTRFETNEI